MMTKQQIKDFLQTDNHLATLEKIINFSGNSFELLKLKIDLINQTHKSLENENVDLDYKFTNNLYRNKLMDLQYLKQDLEVSKCFLHSTESSLLESWERAVLIYYYNNIRKTTNKVLKFNQRL